jgi:aquaporin Z
MIKKLAAEALGTFWLVFGGCGSAVLAAGFPELGIGFVGVSLAFGLTVLTMAYAVGHISGGHFNPAVSLGLAVGGRFAWSEIPFYWAAQVVGGVLAALLLFAIASGAPDGRPAASHRTGSGLSPGGYGMTAALLIEVVLTAGFLIVILGATSSKAPAGFAPIAIGLCLTLIHLISIPVTNTSVNPRGRPRWPCSPRPARWDSSGCSGWRRSSARRSAASSGSGCSTRRTRPIRHLMLAKAA